MEKAVPGDLSLNPLTFFSFHVPERDKSRQDVSRELLISQAEANRMI